MYRALDTRLGREVAIKILPPAFAADPESIRRFEKEARAVASLAHPNVVPLFDVGEEGGLRYAVTELVDGETLRSRLARGALSSREASEIAAQLAQGLAAAHEKGVVHRDMKPENVVLTRSGFARILDFGLAKSTPSAANTEEEVTRSALLTEPGVIAGTVGYMSPEQVRGEPVDGRSDVFSLGVVLWEMLTGQRPFRGGSQVETLNAILKEDPPPDPTLARLPPELERIVRRCLEKRREDRYHSAADLGHDLRGSASSPTLAALRAPAERPRRRFPWWIAAAAAAAAIAASLFLLRPRPSEAPGLPRSLAVLPFRAIGPETAGEHFGLGLADSIIGRLAAVRDLTIRPTSAIARYEAAPAGAAEVGRTLGVDAVLEGTYQKLEGMTRVSVQMTDVGRGALLWSDRIDLAEGRLFELQDEISNRIVEKLQVGLAPGEEGLLGKSQPVPDGAMEQYLSARALLREVANATPQRRVEIVAVFDRIVTEQPDFARAVGARAYARAWLGFVVPTRENHEAALADAERALSLDPTLAEPRVARASVAWSSLGGWDVVTAVRELAAAIERAPNLEIAHLDLARIYYHSGWAEASRREVAEALRLHPFGEAQRMAASANTWLDGPARGLGELTAPVAGDAAKLGDALAAPLGARGRGRPGPGPPRRRSPRSRRPRVRAIVCGRARHRPGEGRSTDGGPGATDCRGRPARRPLPSRPPLPRRRARDPGRRRRLRGVPPRGVEERLPVRPMLRKGPRPRFDPPLARVRRAEGGARAPRRGVPRGAERDPLGRRV